ncbi:hypothetical protein MHYP_G00001390 [Metynnis hypsauchen]
MVWKKGRCSVDGHGRDYICTLQTSVVANCVTALYLRVTTVYKSLLFRPTAAHSHSRTRSSSLPLTADRKHQVFTKVL